MTNSVGALAFVAGAVVLGVLAIQYQPGPAAPTAAAETPAETAPAEAAATPSEAPPVETAPAEAAAPPAEAPAAEMPAEAAAPAAEMPAEAAAPAEMPADAAAATPAEEPAAAAAAAAAPATEKVVRLGTEGAYAPFNFLDASGKLQGFDIEIGDALCAKMQVKCEWVAQDWDGIIPALQSQKYDAIIASMSITAERKEKVDFTDKYYNTPGQFVVPKTGPLTDVSPAGLKGKTLGAQSSTISANYLTDLYAPAGVTVKLYATQDEADADLAAGRLDAMLADKLVAYQWLEKTDDGKCCQFTGEPITDLKYYGEGIGIAVRKGDDELRMAFNKAIAEIIADGSYKSINEKYFPFSIY